MTDAEEYELLKLERERSQGLGYGDVVRTPQIPVPQSQPTSIAGGLLMGLRDPFDAAAQLAEQGASALGVPTEQINQAVGMPSAMQARKTATQKVEELFGAPSPTARAIGNAAIMAPLAALAPAAATLPGSILTGAGLGAASGALQPVDSGDFWTQKAEQVGLGAGAGALGSGVMSGLSRVIAPRGNPNAELLMKEGITPTPGGILGPGYRSAESRLTSIPGPGDAIASAQRKSVDELNRAIYARALNPVGGEIPETVGREAVKSVRTQLNARYDALLPKMKFTMDPQFVSEMTNLSKAASNLPDEQARRFGQIMQIQLEKLTPQGNASGETLQNILTSLRVQSQGYMRDLDVDKRALGHALAEMKSVFDDALSRMNPEQAPMLDAIRKSWGVYAVLRNAAGRQGSTEGIVTPGQLSAAVRAGDQSFGKARYAEGAANLQDLADAAKATLTPGYPDSGTAGRLIMGGGLAGGLGFLSPTTLALGALGSAAYLPYGRQAAASLLTSRPAMAKPLGALLGRAAPAAGVVSPVLLPPLLQQ